MFCCQLCIAAADMILRHTEYKTVEAVFCEQEQYLPECILRNDCGVNDSVRDRIMQDRSVLQNERQPEGQTAQDRQNGKACACRCDGQRQPLSEQL